MSVLLQAALAYAARGLPVFPCVPRAKAPAVKRGFHAATTNPETIRRFWRADDRNISIPTGMISGFWVLDIDGAEGEASLHSLEAQHGPLPVTAQVSTARGRHHWFASTGPIQCSAGRVGAGIDVRGDGGSIIAPPSVHPSGAVYRWSVTGEVVDAPEWLVLLARKRPDPITVQAMATLRRPPGGGGEAYGLAALDYEIAVLASTPPGGRNHALNLCAFRLFQLVAGGELDEQHVVDHLTQACHQNGLVKDDGLRSVVVTINSARAGLKYPRSRSGTA